MTELLVSDRFLAAADPGAPVVHGDPLTYGELRERVAASASALRAELPPRANVLLAMAWSSEAIVAYLATMRAGLAAIPIDPGSTRQAVERILGETGAAASIGDFGSLAPLLDRVPTWPLGTREGGPGSPSPLPEAEAPALVLYTSGTTAAPKGVVLSHGNLAANTASILAAVPMLRSDVVALVLPLHHSYGLSVLHTTLATGAKLAPMPPFAVPSDCVRGLASARATVFPGVPFHFGALLGRPTGFDRNGLPDLRCAMVAGGPMPTRLAAAFAQRFPGVELHVMYGQTEATARLSALPPGELRRHPGSIGRGIPGVELAVLRPNGAEVRPGEIGELYARGENVMRGYLGDETASAEVLTPLGLRTLARSDPAYCPRYEGGVPSRDGAYHQGTVWPWLIGPFVDAWLNVNGGDDAHRAEARRRFLAPLVDHLNVAGLGHVSEIADGDLPHTPRGCPFQAWSLGELIRALARTAPSKS